MAITTLEEKFTFELNSIYDAEHQFLEAQQTMLESANSETVRQMLEKHIAETEQQIVNLSRVHEILGLTAKRETCAAAEGLVTEGNTILSETEDVPSLADLAIAGSNSKVEHFEIAAYGTARSHALQLNNTDAADLLQQTLEEESQTDERLSRLAENRINDQADPNHIQGS